MRVNLYLTQQKEILESICECLNTKVITIGVHVHVAQNKDNL